MMETNRGLRETLLDLSPEKDPGIGFLGLSLCILAGGLIGLAACSLGLSAVLGSEAPSALEMIRDLAGAFWGLK